MPGSTISTAATWRARSPPISNAPARRSRAPTSKRCAPTLAEPLSVAIGAGTLYNTPPPTQGLASLIILALFDRLRVTEAESFDHVHGLIEAAKRALRVRDRYIADPDRLAHPPDRYLADAFLDAEAAAIDRRKRRRRGRRRRARATPSGWAPPTPPASSSPTSSRSTGSSARAWCCRAPAC